MADDSSYANSLTAQSNFLLGAQSVANTYGTAADPNYQPKDLLDQAGDIISKGVPLTAAAIVNSFANTAIEVGNFFGADQQLLTIADEFGPDSDHTAYYNEHQLGIEGTALVVGSLVPGAAAIKALKMAQLSGKLGSALSFSTGVLQGPRTEAIAAAAADLVGNATGESLFGLSATTKTKAILSGFADQALQGAVYETATLATMHANPLTDNNTMSENLHDILDSAQGFGLFGGVLSAAGRISNLKKIHNLADAMTKGEEAFGALGKGNITPGDHILKLYETLDTLPTTPAGLGAMKLNFTRNITNRAIQDFFIKTANGDEELAHRFRSFVEDGRKAGTIKNQELENTFSLMSSMGRLSSTEVGTTSVDHFYLPSSIAKDSVPDALHETLATRISTAANNTLFSPAYTLRNPTMLPVVGRASDTLTLASLTADGVATTAPKFSSVADAYKQSIDVFVDAAGKLHVNPNSTTMEQVARPGESRKLSTSERKSYALNGVLPPGSKPLNSVDTILDMSTGKTYGDNVLPVVGDFGTPKLASSGLQVGDILYPQNQPGLAFAPVNPMEANARYVWAHMRGIKAQDSIHSTDLPLLEQAYREKLTGNFPSKLTTFADGGAIPATANEMLTHIAAVKQSMYADLLAAGKNADEIGHILNAPTKGMIKNFNTVLADELMIPVEQSANIRHVRLGYDIGTIKNTEGNILQGMQATNYRIKLALDSNSNQVAEYLGKLLGTTDPSGKLAQSMFEGLQLTKTSGDASILGAGKSFFTNSNSDYMSLGQQAERIGILRGKLVQHSNSIINDTLAAPLNRLRQDAVAAAEYGNIRSLLQSTGEKYRLITGTDAIDLKLSSNNTLVLSGAITVDKQTNKLIFNPNYMPTNFKPGELGTTSSGQQGLRTFYPISSNVADVLLASQELNNSRNAIRKSFWDAVGIPKEGYNLHDIYMPPINTNNAPFFAYIRQKTGTMMGGGGSSLITATSAEELQTKIASLGPGFDAYTDKALKGYFSAKGEFDYNRSFGRTAVDTAMARQGILNNVAPETRAQTLIEDLIGWHQRESSLLLNDHIELHNTQTFDQLKMMGDRFATTGTSRMGFTGQADINATNNPYMSYVNTALGITPKGGLYPLWMAAQEKLESFGNTVFNTAKAALGGLEKGLLSADAAAKMSSDLGLGNPYGTAVEHIAKNYYGGLVNQLPPPNILSKFTRTANTVLNATMLRLDVFQQLLEITTLPIMVALERAPATKALSELTQVTVPGTKQQVPGLTRLLYNAVTNYFGPKSNELISLYTKGANLTVDEFATSKQLMEHLSIPSTSIAASAWEEKMRAAIDLGSKLSGSNFTNKFVHFIASDVGRQIGEASGQVGQDLMDSIGTFTNRVLGNVGSSQRAGIFSGPVGGAVGLFQSYQWNMMQQLLRHVGDGNVKALAMAGGMQASIFGISSLPGFQALNNIIANKHGQVDPVSGQFSGDIFSGLAGSLPKEISDYLLYGGLSSLLGTGLYGRGDLNIRNATILPVNPLEFPSVRSGISVYKTLAQLATNVTTQGASVPASLMLAAEHNSMSRPLAGLAELMQGFSTDNRGRLLATNSGFSELSNISTMSRIFGARPLEEAVAATSLYRINAMAAKDRLRLDSLGEAVKTAMYGQTELKSGMAETFLTDYLKAGGNQSNFSKWILSQHKGANVSATNAIMESLHSPKAQALQVQLGGTQLPDYRNQIIAPITPTNPLE
jgi:hypothetical protein